MDNKQLTLAHILNVLVNDDMSAISTHHISSVEIDSRKISNGSLFCAFVGNQVDGHDYVSPAFAKGAIAALVERVDTNYAVCDKQWDGTLPVQICVENVMIALQQLAHYWRQLFSVRVIGITGSVGKTTTKELIYSILNQQYAILKSEGNFNNEIGLPLTLLNLRHHHHAAVLEMGMYTLGEIALLADIAAPDIGVITLIGTAHVEHVGSQEALARGKRELVEALPASGIAVLNNDDPLVMAMVPYTKAAVFTYGITNKADLWASNIQPDGIHSVRFMLHYQDKQSVVQLPLPGAHSVYTALRAAAVGLLEGVGWNEIISGLETHQKPLRMVTKQLINNITLIDDTYNASPNSMIAALDLLDNAAGRKVAILGDMLELGSDEIMGHQRVGHHAAITANKLIAVGHCAEIMAEAAVSNGMATDDIRLATDAQMATAIIKEIMAKNDTILVKASRGIALDKLVSILTTNQ